MAVETRPELVGKRFLCVAAGENARPERGQSGCGSGWRAGVIRAVSHRDSGHPDLAVRAGRPGGTPLCAGPGGAGMRGWRAGAWQVGRARAGQGPALRGPNSCALPVANLSRFWLCNRKRWEYF